MKDARLAHIQVRLDNFDGEVILLVGVTFLDFILSNATGIRYLALWCIVVFFIVAVLNSACKSQP